MSFFGDDGDDIEIDDIKELVDYQIDLSKTDTATPFGTYTWDIVGGAEPTAYEDWLAQNPITSPSMEAYGLSEASIAANELKESKDLPTSQAYQDYMAALEGGPIDPVAEYEQYLANFDPGGEEVYTFAFTPEYEDLYNKVVDPDAYDIYQQDYMDDYWTLVDPYRSQQIEDFDQYMYSKGIPEGSDDWNQYYLPLGDEFSRADAMASQTAIDLAEQAQINDFNQLMAAMGGSYLPTSTVDTAAAINQALGIESYNASNDTSFWDYAAPLAMTYFLGAPEDYWEGSWLYPG